MLVDRLKTILIILPIAAVVVYLGGWVFIFVWTGVLCRAAWEYWHIFKAHGFPSSAPVMIGGVMLLAIGRGVLGFQHASLFLSLTVLAVMAAYLIRYERGDDQPASGFAVTLSGILYLGWIGAYILSLRLLPDGSGMYWLVTVLPAIWLADGWAYLVGRRFGRHKMAPRLSPKKSWEGYFAGILIGSLCTMGLAAVWHLAAPGITPLKGLIIGAAVTTLAPLGDLGESMLKRQFGVKDSSDLLPGHGGALDRIDSTLWAGVIGYYLVMLLG